MEKNPDINISIMNPRYNKHIFPVPWGSTVASYEVLTIVLQCYVKGKNHKSCQGMGGQDRHSSYPRCSQTCNQAHFLLLSPPPPPPFLQKSKGGRKKRNV